MPPFFLSSVPIPHYIIHWLTNNNNIKHKVCCPYVLNILHVLSHLSPTIILQNRYDWHSFSSLYVTTKWLEPNCQNKMLFPALISPVMLIKLLHLSVPLFLLFLFIIDHHSLENYVSVNPLNLFIKSLKQKHAYLICSSCYNKIPQ